MNLHEIKRQGPTKASLRQWLIDHQHGYFVKSDIKVLDNGMVDYTGLLGLDGNSFEEIGVPLNKVVSLSIIGDKYNGSFKNFPKICYTLTITNKNFKSLKDLSMDKLNSIYVPGCSFDSFNEFANMDLFVLNVVNNPIKTLNGVHRIKRLNTLWLSDGLQGSVLELFKVQGLETVRIVFDEGKKMTSFAKAIAIVNKHLGKGRAGAIDAQEELIDAGLDDYT